MIIVLKLFVGTFVALSSAVTLTFKNQCSYTINLYDNERVEDIACGNSIQRSFPAGYNNMFRHGTSPDATLVEISVESSRTWYDISTVSPGGGYCTSYEHCKSLTGKVGYNVPLSVTPSDPSQSPPCNSLICESESCPDAYLYPTDDTKTHNCVASGDFLITYCPSNSNTTGNNPPGINDPPHPVTIQSSFTYSGKQAGNVPGSYQMVTGLKDCTRQTVQVSSPVGPMSEEITAVFRGPMIIYKVAIYVALADQWDRVSYYDKDTPEDDNIIFMSNANIDYNGVSSPQGYASANGLEPASSPTHFDGVLSDASDSGGQAWMSGVKTGAEVNVMTSKRCGDTENGEDSCRGYYDDFGYHGWNGGKKMFVTKVMMPPGNTTNQPAIWLLNAQIVRSNQYQCNCRGQGGSGGCGEMDIAEVIETNAQHDRVSTHYYFYDGTIQAGADNFASRPWTEPTVYITIFDDSDDGIVKILQMSENDFNFEVGSIAYSQIKEWLNAS
uniref:glucan endo-1,3-beta-D-glucosidase n=1 Tax=Albugo laibachii Nc14 TaxID=890382 RepID=F0WS16_9STRA|nr:secretory protein OPEL putative [Albugo laibachii Nc14]|eukprot:CCA24134.1 secretory protein OPEL putative [Albugo laibachii Nc14]